LQNCKINGEPFITVATPLPAREKGQKKLFQLEVVKTVPYVAKKYHMLK